MAGKIVATPSKVNRGAIIGNIQMVFQDPLGSFNPRKKLSYSVTEPLTPLKGLSGKQKLAEATRVFLRVGLTPSYLDRYPWELSGGECQRAALARAIVREPKVLICDEITSALDVSVQAHITHLLNELRQNSSMSILFISHDIALVSGLCDTIAVMRDGIITECSSAETIINTPTSDYTKALLTSS